MSDFDEDDAIPEDSEEKQEQDSPEPSAKRDEVT